MSETLLAAPPRLAPLYARALAGSRRRRPPQLPDRVVLVREVPVDADAVARYARVCGFGLTDAAPVTFPHLLAFGAQVHLMAAADFPLPLLGLVHLRQRIAQHRPLRVGERAGVRVWAEHLAAHARGATVDLRAAVGVDGEPVWEGRSTYLARGAQVPPSAGEAPGLPALPEVTGPATATWPVPAGTGRRYAAVSGDVNPIHLSALSARALGFPRAIAHGMWTAERALAALGPHLPAAVTADVAFARPVLLPTTLALLVHPAGGGGLEDGGLDVAVRSHSGQQLHLAGTVRLGAAPV